MNQPLCGLGAKFTPLLYVSFVCMTMIIMVTGYLLTFGGTSEINVSKYNP